MKDRGEKEIVDKETSRLDAGLDDAGLGDDDDDDDDSETGFEATCLSYRSAKKEKAREGGL